MRRATVIGSLALTALALALPAQASSTGLTGTIAVSNGTLSSTSGGTPTLTFGSSVAFSTTTAGSMGSKDSLYITVICTQSSKVVYQASSLNLSYAFPLVSQTGDNLGWNGQAASCAGYLIWRQVSGKNVTINYLGQAPFNVSS